METSLLWLIALTVLLILCATVLVLMFLWFRKERTEIIQQFSSLMTASAQQSSAAVVAQIESTERLLDKAMALAATTDPLSFQSVQAMVTTPSAYDEPYDPSDQGEIDRIQARRDREDELSGSETEFIQDLFDAPGNEFVPAGDHAQWSAPDSTP